MKIVNLKIASRILALGLAVSTTPLLKAQTAVNDLDRDGIPNISDTDVDNDGISNGSDSNIDGGVAKTGLLKGQYIGDRIANDNAAELDMDADGLLDNAANESDIDGDGLADNAALELDIDADGRADTAATESDIDGDGLADNAVNETDIDGDGLADNAMTELDIDGDSVLDKDVAEQDIDGDGLLDSAAAETDIDGDALADNAANETDIDGDGLADGVAGEVDTDGDASANGLDGDVDGDGLANNSDADMNGTGVINDYFQTVGDAAYAPDASVASTIAFVSGEVRRILQIPATDNGLRVRVSAYQFGTWVYGDWRYLSADNIQVYASWAHPSSDSSQLKVFIKWQYTGPHSGIFEDYTNPANYVISEENRLSAQYPGGGFTFIGWVPPEPTGFYFSAPNEQATGFAPPYEKLRAALRSYPNFSSSPQYLDFSGSLVSTPGFPGVQPIINLQRTIMQVSRAWYGQQEARQLR
jgi:hypothetical protein